MDSQAAEKKIDHIERKAGLQHHQVIMLYLMLYDIIAVSGAYGLALWIRFDCHFQSIPIEYSRAFSSFIPFYAVFCVAIFWIFRLYQSVWRFASYTELSRVILAALITAVFHTCVITLFFKRMPMTYYILGFLIQMVFVLGIRFSYRFILLERKKRSGIEKNQISGRVMLIGAGSSGHMILRDMANAKEINDKVYCIIDDNPNKWNRWIDGVLVVGGRNVIVENVRKYNINKIYVAIPTASAADKRDILNICKETGCELKNLPGMYQMVNGDVSVSAMKEVAIEDLLGREPAAVNTDEIFQSLSGKVILVTGGGGSIGSELCRQIAGHSPKQLIVFDVYENNAHEIQLSLQDAYPSLNLAVLIGSVRDSRKINDVFEKYKPDIVYHAAAHKHVPLMEYSPCEAIKNNVLGTYKTAYAAMIHGCRKFVLISTDKAVNPVNIMGASKRLCEMIVQVFDSKVKAGAAKDLPLLYCHSDDEDGSMRNVFKLTEHPCTEFAAVRFGNVLGSNGSVIPRFREQIAKGGPVTVTHPDIVRYFMTISEAVALVLQTGLYGHGGEIFVLDMGSPVKIDTLARNMIRLSGFKPDVDIQIKYTGLRPGEKLYEEKLMPEEGLKTTPNQLIHIGCPISFDSDVFLKQLQDLMKAAYDEDADIREFVREMVTTYQPEDRVKYQLEDNVQHQLEDSVQHRSEDNVQQDRLKALS